MSIGFPKPSASTGRAKRRSVYRRRRPATRAAAFALDGGKCVWPTCRRPLELETDNEFRLAHEHEIVSRSLGGDPLDVDGIISLCWRCHGECHPRVGGKRKRIEGSRHEGLRFWERVQGRWQEVRP